MDKDDLSRREILRALGALAAAPALGGLVACGDEAVPTATTGVPAPAVTGATAGSAAAAPVAATPTPTPMMTPPVATPAPVAPPAPANPPPTPTPAPVMPPAMSGAAGGGAAPMAGPAVPAAPTMCMLSPVETEGPYYLDMQMMRKDITEGRPGMKLKVRARIVDVSADCKPMAGIPFEIWQADRVGDYSGYQNAGGNNATGQVWLRGVQMTDEVGLAEFDTIYPGSYPGRAIHIHFKVHVGGNRIVTSQMYFDETLSAKVMDSPEYQGMGAALTRNAMDGVGRNDYQDLMLVCQEVGDSIVGDMVIGVNMA